VTTAVLATIDLHSSLFNLGSGARRVRGRPTELQIATLLRLLETAHEPAMILWDANATITGWFMGAEKTFGHSAAEAVGQHASMLYTPEDRAAGALEYEISVALQRGYSENDRWMFRKDGGKFWANGILNPIRADDGEVLGFGKSLRNRTDARGRLDALENRVGQLQSAASNKFLPISTLAHELRGPLSAITHATEVLREAAAPSDLGTVAVDIIARQCQSMTCLVEDLLEATRLRTGKMQLRRRKTSLGDIVAAALETCASAAKSRRHSVQLIVLAGDVYVMADAHRLQQVFVNLLQNAIKFTPEGGQIWLKVSSEGHEAVGRVEDTGIGIPPEVLPGIFDMFAQAEQPSDVAKSGLGIGLALVKELVELHGGTVQVRSDGVGKGAEFTVRLPLEMS